MAATATQAHTEERVQVAGKATRVLRGGSGDTIVTLHHSTGSVGWLPLHERLAENFSVVAPDMPGYGQSERPEWARDPRDLAILVNHTLEKLKLDRVTLVGFGFGGFVAAELATMDASRLKKLVLVGAAGILPKDGEIMDGMLMDLNEYMAAGFRDDAAFHAVFGEEPDASVKELWDFSREMTARVCWKPYMYNRHLPHLLQDVATPTLLIWGSEDKVIPPVCGEQYRDALPNAKLEVIPGAGHYVEFEDPARIAGLIAAHARA
ncbi:MAG: alpha/beta fold hydrolase [Dehalococcoidia bacterium]